MSNESSSNAGSFLNLSNVLTIIFILLKVFGKITWSWWIVFLPTIIPIVIVLGIFAVFAFMAILVAVFDK